MTYFYLIILLAIFCNCQTGSYYVNITEKIIQMHTLPFHYTSTLLDDTMLLNSNRDWISIYEDNGNCLNVRCTKDPESCFNLKKSSEVTQDELVPVNNLLQRFLADDDTDSSGSENENKYMLLSDICGPGQYCDINLNNNGICVNYTASYVERESLVVGQECTDDMYWKICGTGSMRCDNYQCAPITENMLCQSSNDCLPSDYCNPEGKCVPTKKPGEACIEQDECGRIAACYFADLRKKTGECVEYFTKVNGENVATYTGHDAAFASSANSSIFYKYSIFK